MSTGVSESIGFVLHSRRFRENSRIVDAFTQTHGKVSLLARVSARPGSANAVHLQPFRLVLFRWRGKRELKNLQSFDALDAMTLDGAAGICGLYCNEVLLRLLPELMPQPDVFQNYRETLTRMHAGEPLGASLRRFEWRLLNALGYAADLTEDCLTGAPLIAAEAYYFLPGRGFSAAMIGRDAIAVSSDALIALRNGDFSVAGLQRDFRRVTSAALRQLLGPKELKSRKLMQQLTQYRRGQ